MHGSLRPQRRKPQQFKQQRARRPQMGTTGPRLMSNRKPRAPRPIPKARPATSAAGGNLKNERGRRTAGKAGRWRWRGGVADRTGPTIATMPGRPMRQRATCRRNNANRGQRQSQNQTLHVTSLLLRRGDVANDYRPLPPNKASAQHGRPSATRRPPALRTNRARLRTGGDRRHDIIADATVRMGPVRSGSAVSAVATMPDRIRHREAARQSHRPGAGEQNSLNIPGHHVTPLE